MGLGEKIKEFIAPVETEEELQLSEEEAEALSTYEQPQLEGASRIAANANIVLFEPRVYDEAAEIAQHIKQKRACCINLHVMPSEHRQRTIDFLSGVVYGLDGSISRVGEHVILCTPKNMPVGGSISVNGSEEY